MGYLAGLPIKDTNATNFSIWKDKNGTFYFKQGKYILNDEEYLNFANTDIKDVIDKNVLVAGLGLGIVPQWLAKRRNKVDVIEIDKELIQAVTFYDYLDDKINIYWGDIFVYPAKKEKYDLAFIDVWWNEKDKTKIQIDLIEEKFRGIDIVYPL